MQIIKKYKKIIISLLFITLTISVIGLKYYLLKSENTIIEEKEEKIKIKKEINEEKKEEEKIYVDIKGAVKVPGVYPLNKESRVIDLIKTSGGITENADTTYINLAQKLKDEMVVIIYTKDQIKESKKKETISTENINNSCICPKITNDVCITKENQTNKSSEKNTSNNPKEDNSTEKININTANIETLQTLTGIGQSKAQAIIDYREQNGNFKTIEEIKNISGIGESLYEKIKDNITI